MKIPSKVLMATLAVSLLPAMAGAQGQEKPPVKVIHMTAQRYKFTPNVITAIQGQRVRIIITALDRKHGFKLAAYHIDQILPKGDPATIEFTANKAGTFTFRCSVFCGIGHLRMKGKLIVKPAKKPQAGA